MIARFYAMSGGKDSGAAYLSAIRRGKPFRAVFADTDNEHPSTYEYIYCLADKTGGPKIETAKADFTGKFPKRRENLPIKWAKLGVSDKRIAEALEVMHPTGNAFLDLCLLRGGFPSAVHRFCTQELKLSPTLEQYYIPAIEAGEFVVAYTGVRASESYRRSLQSVRTRAGKPFPKALYMPACVKPIFDWSVEDVVRIHAEMGVALNPLYELGAERVGCWPCINVRKEEFRMIARLSPEQIDRLEAWERIVTKISLQGFSAFLPPTNVSRGKEKWTLEKHGIREQVKWANTARGGKKQLFPDFAFENENSVHAKYETACELLGACE